MQMKRTSVFLRALLLAATFLTAGVCAAATGQVRVRTIERVKDHASYLEIQTSDGRYLFKPYAANMLETSFIPNGEQFNPVSHAVVMAPQAVPTRLWVGSDKVRYTAGDLVVTVDKSPLRVSYAYKDRLLISEKDGYTKGSDAEILNFNLDADEALYGGGARALGMNRRGNRLPLYNKAHYGYEEHSAQMNFATPLVFSSKMYGIHFDNAAIGTLDLDSKKDKVLAYETIGGRKTYQIIAGDSWEQIVGSYTRLTGRQPLPPRWTFGNFASRFGYHSEQEARAILDKFEADQIPVDAIVFDLYWFGKDIKGTLGNLEFDRDNFPNPQKMMADFASKGVKTVLITEPFILTTSGKWDEAVQKHILATDKDGKPFTYDFYFGHTGLIDIFDPAAKTWFWNEYKKLKAQGVAGWWGDLGEPEVHPSALQHKIGSADQVHNIYGHEWARLIAEGYRKDFPGQRPFILMRSGYSGSQRYGMIPWSGDVNRTWGGMRSQPEIALQMGMQGMAYMHSDLGGFAGANLDDELYARWLQYGVFQPVFRPHAQEEVPSEPVLRDAKAKALAKAAIELRYQLLPYNYTLAFDNNQQGLPFMRPLFYAEPRNRALYALADSYLWGRDFLVHPIMNPGQQEANVYFPADSAWYDFYSGQRYAGGAAQTVSVAADHIPVFVRAGAFVPMIKTIQNTRLYSTKSFDLHYFHDAGVAAGEGKLYDDDGETAEAYEHGRYELLQFSSRYSGGNSGGNLTLRLQSSPGEHWEAPARTVNLVIHNVTACPASVSVNGAVLPMNWDAQKNQLTATLAWKGGEQNAEQNIVIQLQN